MTNSKQMKNKPVKVTIQILILRKVILYQFLKMKIRKHESDSCDDQTNGDETNFSDDTSMTPPDESEAIKTPSDYPVVSETIVNPSWQPIGTKQ